MKLNYLQELGYSEKEIKGYSSHWNENIIELLANNSENVSENMRYMMPFFDKDLILKLTVFYPEAFLLSPKIFADRLGLLQNEFPSDWQDIVEKQFYGYDGIPGSNYKPFLCAMGQGDEGAAQNAVKMLSDPSSITFEFMALLSEKCNISVCADDFNDSFLWDLEDSKWEVVRNVQTLTEEGISQEIMTDILIIAPFLMCLSKQEVRERLISGFGENYIEKIGNTDAEELYEILESIAW